MLYAFQIKGSFEYHFAANPQELFALVRLIKPYRFVPVDVIQKSFHILDEDFDA